MSLECLMCYGTYKMSDTDLHKEIREHVTKRIGNLEEDFRVFRDTTFPERAAKVDSRLDAQDKILADIHKFVRYKAPSLYSNRRKVKLLPIIIMVVTIGFAAAYHWIKGDFFTWVFEIQS